MLCHGQIQQIQQCFEQSKQPIAERIQVAIGQLLPISSSIPLPAQGKTYQRWQILSVIAAINLNVAKIFESHLDALAILQELGEQPIDANNALYAVWAAEGSPRPLQLHESNQTISGTKQWCSAALEVKYGLITYRNPAQQSQLVLVEMDQNNIGIEQQHWHAVGMQHTATANIHFDQTSVQLIGQPQDYLKRAGFWHGAAGVAACWHGCSVKLAQYLQRATAQKPHAFKHFYLGEISTALAQNKILFQHVAQLIDATPLETHELMIRMLRARIEEVATQVLNTVGQALGAAPFCLNEDFAQAYADLTVFIRQSHAAFDLQQIAELTLQQDQEQLWQL